MVLFEVKLICPKTKEVIFTSINKKPILPPDNLFKRVPRPLLVITTRDSVIDLKKLRKI
jgi:hypothetical protein